MSVARANVVVIDPALGKTFVEMTDGSKWKQAEYHYEYHYAYRPEATVTF